MFSYRPESTHLSIWRVSNFSMPQSEPCHIQTRPCFTIRVSGLRRRGKIRAAGQVLLEALDTPNYPYASHAEADEHIYTSLAATSLKAMQTRAISNEDGRRQVLTYLDKAQSRAFFDRVQPT